MIRTFRLFTATIVLVLSITLATVSPVSALTVPAEINQSFTPIAILSGDQSRLRVSIYNVNTNPLTGAAWTDNLWYEAVNGNPVGLLVAATPSVTNTCGGGSTVVVAPDKKSFSLSGGTVPAKDAQNNPGSCYVELWVTSTTPGNLINTIPAGALTSTTIDGGVSVPVTTTSPSSATLNVIAVQPPSLSKSFLPNTISVGQKSRLTITVTNNDTENALHDVTLTDALPSGVTLANPVQNGSTAVLTGCGSGTLLNGPGGSPVAPGDAKLTLSGATIARSSSCVITVDVTSLVQGAHTNTIPASPTGVGPIRTREGVTNASPASDILNVQALNVTKAFGTSPIPVGGTSLMTITITNGTSVDYTGLALVDTLPTPADSLEFVNDGSLATTCGTGTVAISTVPPATTDNRLTLSGGTVRAGTSCTVTAHVRARMNAAAATYTNIIPVGAVTTQAGAKNDSQARASLTVQTLTVAKAFSPTSFAAGQTSTLTITITNPSPNAFTQATLADTLPTLPNSNLFFTGTPHTTCTTLFDPASVTLTGSPTRTVQLSNGRIPANGSCTITATVTTTASAPAANYTGVDSNRIPADSIHTNEGGTNSNTATAPVSVTTISVAKSYLTSPVAYPNASRLTITITNPVTGGALTGITFTDALDSQLEIVDASSTPPSVPPASGPSMSNCGGSASLTATAGTQTIQLTGGSLPAAPTTAQVCTIHVWVRPKSSTSSTTGSGIANTIGPGAVTTNEGPINSNTTTAHLRVNSVSVSKSFLYSSFEAGGSNTLTITLTNPTGAAYTGATLSDTLPTTPNSNLEFTGTPNTTCAPGTVALSGTRTVDLSNGTIPAGGSCTITVPVTSHSASDPAASYTNTIPVSALVIPSGPTNTTPAPANVSIYPLLAGMTAAKSFTPATISIGGNSDLQLTFTAPADTAISGFQFTDTLPPGLTISNLHPATNSCGGSLDVTSSPDTISLSGGSIAIGGTCTVHVWVTGNQGSGAGTPYTNTISPGDIKNTEARSIPAPVVADLTVQTPSTLSVQKAFFPAVVSPDGVSMLKITLTNTSASRLVNVSLTDSLPSTSTGNEVLVASPRTVTTDCAADTDVTALPGSHTITLANGTVPAAAGAVAGVCTINVGVVGKSTDGTHSVQYLNTIPVTDVVGTIEGTGSAMNATAPASATLKVQNLDLEVVKAFYPQLVYGGASSKLTITLRNPNPAAELTGIHFTDNMAAGEMLLVDPPNFDPSACGPDAVLTGTPGTSTFTFTGGYLAPGTECTMTMDVTMLVNGNRTNTIPALAVSSSNGAQNRTATAASLTNLAGASLSKSFSPGEIAAGLGNYSTLTILIHSTETVPLTALGLVDNLPTGLQVSGGSAPAPTNTCGGTFAAPAGATTVELSGGALPIGYSTCTLTVSVSGEKPGLYTNTIPPNSITNDQHNSNQAPAVAALRLTPYSLGNRVWYDANDDGLLNNGETGISGVRVSLYSDNGTKPGVYDSGDTFVGATTTDASGYYRFDNLDAGTYVVVIGGENFRDIGAGDTVTGNPLANYYSSGTVIAADGTPSDTFGPNPTISQTDSDDNGLTAFNGSAVDYVAAQSVTLGPGLQPLGETDPLPNPLPGEAPDKDNNRTVDFGFYRVQLGKTLVTTSEAFTSDTNVAIGEIVTYEVTRNLAAGASLANVVLTDRMSKGLAYVDCTSVMVGGQDRTSDFCPGTPPNLVVSPVVDAGDSPTNPANNGRQVEFHLGDVSNTSGGDSSITIRYRAVVLDVAENKNGSALHNVATWAWTGSSSQVAGPTLKVVEPKMSITKQVTPANAKVGTIVTYTMDVAHTASSAADSFDVTVTDALPSGLTYVDGSAAATGFAPTSITYDPAAATLHFVWDIFPLGQTSHITFQAAYDGPPPVTNAADLAWTSLSLDPLPSGVPVQLTTYNDHSTERRFNPTDTTGVDDYSAHASVTIGASQGGNGRGGGSGSTFQLPHTGFAPGVVSPIPEMPANIYNATTGILVEIPKLGLKTPLVGVPQSGNTWDVTWLGADVGYLNGTAYPTLSGNTVLTGHVYLSDGQPGPFVNLHTLGWGDEVVLHISGERYVYRIQSNKVTTPEDNSVFQHETSSWLTLVTCKDYDAKTDSYRHRVVLRAALMRVEPDTP